MAETFWSGPGLASMVERQDRVDVMVRRDKVRTHACCFVPFLPTDSSDPERNWGRPWASGRWSLSLNATIIWHFGTGRSSGTPGVITMGKKPRERASGPQLEPSGSECLPPACGSWPGWARGLVTAGLIYHMAAVGSGALGVPPSSLLERRIADLFTPYHDLVDQGYAYRYYAEPPPTPVITATLRYEDGRPAEVVRLPSRSLSGPRMRHQRQLALANALFGDFQDAKQRWGDGSRSRLAGSYARHLCSTHAGCTEVTLHAQQHLIPDPDHVREELAAPGIAQFELFDESLFTSPEWIGDFTCDGS